MQKNLAFEENEPLPASYMAAILTTLKSLLGPELAGPAAAQLGENASSVQKALHGLLPLVLGGLINRTETPGGSPAALNLSQQAYNTIGSSLASPGSVLQLLGAGSEFSTDWLSTLFGSVVGPEAIASALSGYAGIAPRAAGALLALVGPAVLGLVGRQAVNSGLNANGFATMLAGLKPQVQALMPADLSGLAGLLGLGGLEVATGAPTSPPRPGAPAAPSRLAAPPSKVPARWPLILLAVAAIAALLYFLRSCDKATETTPAATMVPAARLAAAPAGA